MNAGDRQLYVNFLNDLLHHLGRLERWIDGPGQLALRSRRLRESIETELRALGGEIHDTLV